MTTSIAEAPTGADEDTTTLDAPDGKLFEVPRVKVITDESDPTVLKLAISGNIELDRANANDVNVYNALAAGQDVELHVEAFVAGAKKRQRRDSEGDVDAVVETKSLIVHSLLKTDSLTS